MKVISEDPWGLRRGPKALWVGRAPLRERRALPGKSLLPDSQTDTVACDPRRGPWRGHGGARHCVFTCRTDRICIMAKNPTRIGLELTRRSYGAAVALNSSGLRSAKSMPFAYWGKVEFHCLPPSSIPWMMLTVDHKEFSHHLVKMMKMSLWIWTGMPRFLVLVIR